MQNSTGLDLSLKQGLTLTPQLQQAIKILNMSSIDLQLEISQMLSQNFMLEQTQEFDTEIRREDDAAEEHESLIQELSEELDYDSDWDNHYDHDWQDHQPYKEEENNLEQYISSAPELGGYLAEQIAHMPISAEVQQAATILAFELDEDGYFRGSLKKIAKEQKINPALLEQGLQIIRQCQPTGVGAYDLEECLNLQIEMLPKNTPYLEALKRIMARYFGFIVKNPAMIRQRLNMDESVYEHAIALLRSLNPRPGQSFNSSPTQYVQPEIIVREKGGISYIETTDGIRPKLFINAAYAQMTEAARGQDKTLLQAQLQEARWFLTAIDKRADTIRRVAGVIVALQQDFFQHGEAAMRPLTRQKVAEMLDIHESTVSRAVNGKYLMCKRGIFELRYFFSTQLENSDGEDQSTIAIKATIAELISQEDPVKPLSDQKIADLLAKEGQKIARRTVTKYRESMDIPTTSVRRKR